MIFRRSRKYTVLSAFAAIAMLLRVAIPTGFMPSNIDDGWFLQLCPDGMPTHVMVALFGEHHLHHGDSDGDTFFQCDYDGGVVGDALLADTFLSCSVPSANTLVASITGFQTLKKPVLGFSSRAPPAHLRLTG